MFEDDIRVVFVYGGERADLRRIRSELCEIAEKEATYLYRLAWRMQRHGCSAESIRKVREEANELHMTAYPERLIDWTVKWEYAFRI